MNAFKKRRSRFRQAVNPPDPRTPGKKRKVVVEPAVIEDIDAAALAIARSISAKNVQSLVNDTAPLRCTWVTGMQDNNVPMIPETFMKKFPCFVADASLLHEDYKCNMRDIRDYPVVDFAAAFKKVLPAIYQLAEIRKLIPANTPRPTQPDEEAWLGCKLLINLVLKYCKRNTLCKPERLFAEGWDSTYINALHQIRRDIKQSAPMIFIITDFPAHTRTYLVATDDFALKVKGTFLDSLQCLMELHYVFDLAYAKELKPFFLLLELIADLDVNKSYTSLMDLYYDLKNLEGLFSLAIFFEYFYPVLQIPPMKTLLHQVNLH
uniref:Uncharacterized protein n=1 Tax=Panagrolaimus superbus TaxID=310955 RepID=A0A914Y5W3_9BILA